MGPTASGKTGLSLDLAERLDAEIVNADAFQLYRGMDIGTAKVMPTHRRGIPHHQLDLLDLHREASVAAYQAHARADIDGILARGRAAIVVGGSGLYMRAVLDDLDIPPTDPAVRGRLEAELVERGSVAMWELLQRRDPVSAGLIDHRNTRRVVRALEVVELTGAPFTAALPRRQFRRPTILLGLDPVEQVLDGRIEHRTEQMWADGFLDEVARLRQAGLPEAPTASRAVGYQQALDQLAGRLSEREAITETITATRRLARRQRRWFRGDPRTTWLDAADPALVDSALAAAGPRPPVAGVDEEVKAIVRVEVGAADVGGGINSAGHGGN